MNAMNPKIYNISSLNRSVKQILDSNFGLIWVEAEISNFSIPSSGHWYFTLKDHHAQVRCAMFYNKNRFNSKAPKDGDQVLVKARVGLFEPKGEYQLIIEFLENAGIGLLQREFEQLKTKLQKLSWFDEAKKKPLPSPLTRLGVITSATGAAIQDIISVIRRRSPQMELIIYPVLVQGKEAAKSLTQAVNIATLRDEVDALLLTRGGGSFEDLHCFNDEKLATAIHHCHIPVISAVGHEVDFTICDFVADLRAPTPTAAAELLSRDNQVLIAAINKNKLLLMRLIKAQLEIKQQQLDRVSLRLTKPNRIIADFRHKVVHLQLRLKQNLQQSLSNDQIQLQQLEQRLHILNPNTIILQNKMLLESLKKRSQRAIYHQVQHQYQKIQSLSKQLNMLSPLATLERGYSITLNQNGQLIESIEHLKVGDEIQNRLSKGLLYSKITKLLKN